MMRSAVPVGLAVGGALAVLLAWPAADAWFDLADARGEAAVLARATAAPAPAPAPLIERDRALRAADAAAARGALAGAIRALAQRQSLLVEEVAPAAAPGDRLAAVRFSLSGSEKAVLAMVEALEGDRPLARLRDMDLESLPDGSLRLSGTLVAPWRA